MVILVRNPCIFVENSLKFIYFDLIFIEKSLLSEPWKPKNTPSRQLWNNEAWELIYYFQSL